MEINCVFSNPVAEGESDFFEYSEMNCTMPDISTSSTSTLPEYFEKITSTSTPENFFYIQKTMDYGEIILTGFFILFLVFSAVNLIRALVFKTILK